MTDRELKELKRDLHLVSGISGTYNRRCGMEHRYFHEYWKRGVRVGGKYRP